MENLEKSNVLVVGAGGIGCELLKDLVMWHFRKITVVDLDTIDVSNLNRQFLFRKEHVGQSKALTAKNSVLAFNPNVEVNAIHDDIMSDKYDVAFFKTFDVVLNALDNRTARNYVNRMCLKGNIPLIESGTTGYRGQVQVILKGKTSCYECYPKPVQKQYPACTIRNTPSEPIHCVVWAKFLFNQLFGEPDADEDVVPDQNDPELADAGTENGNVVDKADKAKVNIRSAWVVNGHFNASILLRILFCDNINSLLSMKSLWMKDNRIKPVILDQSCLDADITEASNYISTVTGGVRDQDNLSLLAWCQVFKKSALTLREKLHETNEPLHWDKDDVVSMDFVAAAANIRMSLFHILPMQIRFEIKSMAGNIIPAIATTNALIAGITVLQAYKILNGQSNDCLDVMVSDFVSARGKIIQAVQPLPPVKDCYVCATQQELVLKCKSAESFTLKMLKTNILEKKFEMLAPNVSVMNKARVLIDGGEEDEDQEYLNKTLANFEISTGTILRCSDFLQQYEFNLEINFCADMENLYEIIGNVEETKKTAKEDKANDKDNEHEEMDGNNVDHLESAPINRKRKLEEDGAGDVSESKMRKCDVECLDEDDEDDLIFIS